MHWYGYDTVPCQTKQKPNIYSDPIEYTIIKICNLALFCLRAGRQAGRKTSQPASQPASQPVAASKPAHVRPSSTSATVPEFLHNKSDHSIFTKLVLMKIYLLCHDLSFYLLLIIPRVHNREESVKLPYALSKMSPLSTVSLNGFL